MANYTGSPLGLIPDFGSNGTNSQNAYKIVGGSAASLFSSDHKFLKRSKSDDVLTSKSDPLSFGNKGDIHSKEVYDISTTNIIENLKNIGALKLKPADFIYAQDYGVYPNNRLIVCRRFGGPVGDDLTRSGAKPVATLVSWFSDEEPPINFEFGEFWETSNESLKDILNEFGQDITRGAANRAGLGGILARLGDAIPLPGITEVLQRQILSNLGVIGAGASKLPAGDPNLVMESSKRKLVSMEQPGSGLKGIMKVKVNCKWEQKFIAGVDPTTVYYDILRTILTFGGSNATFYLGASKAISGIKKFISKLESDPIGTITGFITGIGKSLKTFLNKIVDFLKGGKVQDDPINIGAESLKLLGNALDTAGNIFTSIIRNVTLKYKIRIMAVLNYLTGSASGPWHVTIGNPLRPILSCGDMITQNVTVKLGPTLAFNDLPSTIECDFELVSARNLGIGEIFGKLSCGKVRITKKLKTDLDVKDDEGNSLGQVNEVDVLSSQNDNTFYDSETTPELKSIDQQIAESPTAEEEGDGGSTQETKVDTQ